MTINFNDYNYNKYDFSIKQQAQQKTKEVETKEVANNSDISFKGLEDETDLLTQCLQSTFGVKLGKFTTEDADIADSTNEILASLGYDYKVSATQVANINKGMNEVVFPDLKMVEDGAVAAHIQDPNGPFADLFI